jgi:1-acyl-sn-glycerol-3-phosphate acyltransferase
MLPFKKGAFRLAIDAGVPVVPFCIEGTHDALPKGNFLIQKRPLTIRFGAPISSEPFQAAEDLQGMSDAARRAILELKR